MSFTADKQTLDDLNLLGKYKPYAIYSLFNKVKTTGGERLLENMFRQPLSDPEEINGRSGMFQYFGHKALDLPFDKEQLALAEDYLGGDGGNLLATTAGAMRKKLSGILTRDEAYGMLQTGVETVIIVLKSLSGLLDALEEDGPFGVSVCRLKEIVADRRLAPAPLSLRRLAVFDHLFRKVLRREMTQVLEGIYQLDVYLAVSKVAREKGFSYARALPREDMVLRASALRHPGIDRAVANPISLHAESNMLFLTGANMAGKSTFMKSFGIAVYMAHLGFPVAAADMVFSVRDGIYSSINVPDNLHLGYSHFYAEVLRVKTVAEEVSAGKDLVVIFDELFKGTNVKDAYDATLAVTEALSEYRNCLFVISTHIIEVGEDLRRKRDNVQFAYLPTVMEGMIPRYTYKMEQGITSDRHGMLIIENEKILDILI